MSFPSLIATLSSASTEASARSPPPSTLRLHCATFNLGGRPPPCPLPASLLGLAPEQRRALGAGDTGIGDDAGGGADLLAFATQVRHLRE